MSAQPNAAFINYAIPAIIVGLVMLRLLLMRRARRLRLETLWIVPVLFAGVTGLVLHQAPPAGLQRLYLLLALIVGAAVGWRRGALMKIEVDPETHALNQRASPAAILVLVALVLVRKAPQFEAGSFGFNVAFVTDLLMVFALGLISATRLEMFLRARRLLKAALADVFS